MQRLCPPSILLCAALLLSFLPVASAQTPFGLRAGDRVVFYGDSITEQQFFTRDVEIFALTRFPSQRMRFFNAGIGGDKVSGGGGGPIGQRLPRDLFALQPSVITVMLGMNDGYYKPFDPGVLNTFDLGYRHIVTQIQQHAASARVTLIASSPYDEFTHPGGIAGYNDTLLHLGEDIKQIGTESKMSFVDFNAPASAALKKGAQIDPELATFMTYDRVHPAPGLHWVMADALLKSWNAPAEVSTITIDAASAHTIASHNAVVTGLKKDPTTLTWQATESALPLPLFVGPDAIADPIDALSLAAAPIVADLDQETLIVHGLPAATYTLKIDGTPIHNFSSTELDAGINLAVLPTPMLAQAQLVALLNDGKLNLDMTRNRMLRGTLDATAAKVLTAIKSNLDKADEAQWAAAQPVPHRFSLEKTN